MMLLKHGILCLLPFLKWGVFSGLIGKRRETKRIFLFCSHHPFCSVILTVLTCFSIATEGWKWYSWKGKRRKWIGSSGERHWDHFFFLMVLKKMSSRTREPKNFLRKLLEVKRKKMEMLLEHTYGTFCTWMLTRWKISWDGALLSYFPQQRKCNNKRKGATTVFQERRQSLFRYRERGLLYSLSNYCF